MDRPSVRIVVATRYVAPLKEGGSLPAIVEADDDGLYVLKFRGAGQGPKALVAELVAGELARAAGLAVPELVFIELDGDLARTEPDPEIQDLIKASVGRNLGLDYLPGSVTFDPVAEKPDSALASAVVWFDAFVSNVDRTAKNPNLLLWHRRLHLIDHGAAFYFHHAGKIAEDRASDSFPRIKDHVLLPFANSNALEEADARLSALVTPEVVKDVVALVPDDWLVDPSGLPAPTRKDYGDYLTKRLEAPRAFTEEAIRARSLLV